MHSFFKLPFYPLLPDDPNLSLQRGRIHEFFKYTKPHRKLLEQIELVIIDEISMVRADIIDAIDRILRVYSHNLREPFGGKQLLLVGDVFQLEPVVKNDEREILNRFYPTPYFFSARVFGQIDRVPSLSNFKKYIDRRTLYSSVSSTISAPIQPEPQTCNCSTPATEARLKNLKRICTSHSPPEEIQSTPLMRRN